MEIGLLHSKQAVGPFSSLNSSLYLSKPRAGSEKSSGLASAAGSLQFPRTSSSQVRFKREIGGLVTSDVQRPLPPDCSFGRSRVDGAWEPRSIGLSFGRPDRSQ